MRVDSFQGAAGITAAIGSAVSGASRTRRNLKQMETTMPIHSNLLSWLFGHPQIAEQEIMLTTRSKPGGRDPVHLAVRWWGSHSPPDTPGGLNRRLLQDIGLDRSRS